MNIFKIPIIHGSLYIYILYLGFNSWRQVDANNQKTTTNALERLANHVHRTREDRVMAAMAWKGSGDLNSENVNIKR